MEMEKMIELIDAVSKSDLTGFKYEEDGIKLHLSKKENTCYVTENVSAPVNMTGTASAGVVSAEMGKTNAEGDQTLGAAAEEAVAGNIVESPLVGTFYSAPAEDAESFVKVGDRVSGAPLKPCMKCDDCQKGNFSLCKHYSFIGSREQGSNADYVVIPEQNAVVYDSSISYEQAAMFEPSTVALHGLLQNEYQGGQYVAVLGGGTIGMFTMQWAKIFGSRKVVVFDISEERLELAKRLGADAVINTTKENYMQEAMALTGKKGYGYVFETAGQIPTMHMAFELAGNKANVCFIGTPHAELTFTPAMWENMNRKEFHLTGSWMSYSAPFPGKEWELTAHYFATGQLKFDPGFIYKKVPMSQAQEAFQMFKTPGLVKGKVLLVNES